MRIGQKPAAATRPAPESQAAEDTKPPAEAAKTAQHSGTGDSFDHGTVKKPSQGGQMTPIRNLRG